MTYEDLMQLDNEALLDELTTPPVIPRTKQANIEYYEGDHPIVSDPERADFSQTTYQKDENGDVKKDESGSPLVSGSRIVTRARIVLSYPKQIVTTKTAMIAGNGVDIVDNNGDDDETFNNFSDIFNDKIKVPSLIKDAIKTTAIETNCALIFFFKNGDNEQGLKAKLLSHLNGDTIYPYFDSDGDLIAFTREFTNKTVVDNAVVDQLIIQSYFADKVLISTDGEITEEKNPYGKIPVVYFDQVYPEFKDAKDLITNQEYATSQHYEVNRRIGNPPLLLTGDVTEMPDPAADVKTFKAKSGKDIDGNEVKADIKLIEAQSAPESLKLQFQNIDKNIERASWMDLSKLLEAAKGTGLSGFALQVAMTDAFATRSAQISTYEDGMTRIISIMKTMLSLTKGGAAYESLSISHVFKPLLPDDVEALTAVLAEAKQAGFTSTANAVRNFPLNETPSQVEDEIKQEENANQ